MAANVSLTLLVAERAPCGASRGEWWSSLRRPPRPSKHLALIKRATPGAVIHASGEAIGYCVAVTDRELIIGRARWFGSRVERHDLSRLLRVRRIANRTVDVLEMEFAGMPPGLVIVLYDVRARADFAAVIARLQRRIAPSRSRVATRAREARASGRHAHLRPV